MTDESICDEVEKKQQTKTPIKDPATCYMYVCVSGGKGINNSHQSFASCFSQHLVCRRAVRIINYWHPLHTHTSSHTTSFTVNSCWAGLTSAQITSLSQVFLNTVPPFSPPGPLLHKDPKRTPQGTLRTNKGPPALHTTKVTFDPGWCVWEKSGWGPDRGQWLRGQIGLDKEWDLCVYVFMSLRWQLCDLGFPTENWSHGDTRTKAAWKSPYTMFRLWNRITSQHHREKKILLLLFWSSSLVIENTQALSRQMYIYNTIIVRWHWEPSTRPEHSLTDRNSSSFFRAGSFGSLKRRQFFQPPRDFWIVHITKAYIFNKKINKK